MAADADVAIEAICLAIESCIAEAARSAEAGTPCCERSSSGVNSARSTRIEYVFGKLDVTSNSIGKFV